MTPFEITLNQQRDTIEVLNQMVRSLNMETLTLKHSIITAASYAVRNNPEAAIDLIIRASEAINSETTDKLANHKRATNHCGN